MLGASEIIEIQCPFCKENVLKAIHKEQTFKSQKIRITSGRSTNNIKSPARTEIISESCPNCGKTKKEIEKALKEGKQVSREQIIERMKKAGLPLRF